MVALGVGLVAYSIAVLLMFGPPSVLSLSGGVLLQLWGLVWPGLWLASMFWRPKRWPVPGAALAEDAEPPLITILAPARNEAPVAERLVRTYLEQDYTHWQLIVIANNCTDDTAELARRAAGGDPRVEVFECSFENGVKSDALNRAIPLAKGDVILEMDADNHLPQGYLGCVADAFADPEVQAVQTQIRAGNGRDNLLAAWQDLEFLVYSEVWNRGRATLGLAASIGGTGFAIRPDALRKMGGWSRDLVEDYELHTRLTEAGILVRYLGRVRIMDEKPVSWGALIQQRRRWIRGHLEVAMRRARNKNKMGFIDEIYLYSPVLTWISMCMFAMGYSSILFPNLIHGYAYFSPWFWFASLVTMMCAITLVVIRARDWYLLPHVPAYLMVFGFHWIVVFVIALFPVQWSHTKTVHGVSAKRGLLPWLGVDSWQSFRMGMLVLGIAIAWMTPLFNGLETAPPAKEAPILWGGRSIAYVAYAHGAEAAGSVSGTVRNHGGRPLEGADVTLTSLDGGEVTHALTPATGNFLFSGLATGRFRIDIAKAGLQPVSATFDVPVSRCVRVDVILVASGPSGVIIVPVPY